MKECSFVFSFQGGSPRVVCGQATSDVCQPTSQVLIIELSTVLERSLSTRTFAHVF